MPNRRFDIELRAAACGGLENLPAIDQTSGIDRQTRGAGGAAPLVLPPHPRTASLEATE